MKRKTIKKQLEFNDISLHNGKKSKLTLIPSYNGIYIKRTDINNGFYLKDKSVTSSKLSSSIGVKNCIVSTVEHLFATLHACEITDLTIEIDSDEIPGMDGSALPYIEAIEATGFEELNHNIEPIMVTKKIELKSEDKYISIEPSNSLILNYEINFEHKIISKQSFTFDISKNNFMTDLAPARTFGFTKDMDMLKKIGLAKGASLKNVIALDQEGIINNEGLRFSNEFARHKTLDLLGDLYLNGTPVRGIVSAKFAGHSLHQELLNKITS